MYMYMYMCIMVSTVQAGSHISRYMDNPGGELQKTLARIGMDTLLDMVSTVCVIWCTMEEVVQMHHVHNRVIHIRPCNPLNLLSQQFVYSVASSVALELQSCSF